jgi:membrane-associated protease RseP (regulator of RpoE activity)
MQRRRWEAAMSRGRALAVACAAIGLIAWVDPKTAGPAVTQEAAAEEAKRQVVYVLKARAKELRRVEDIAFRIEVANQDLCADRRPRLGLSWDTAEAFSGKSHDAAIEAYRLGDGLTVTSVVSGGPAAAAGVQPGDVVVSLNGEAPPVGKNAADKFNKRQLEVLGQSTRPVTLVVRRAGQELALPVTPVMACAYGVAVEDSADINAFADGRNIHVNRPMLRLATTDDELALVIAHEIAHDGQHHIQAKAHNARILGIPGLLLDIAEAANGVDTHGAFSKAGAQFGMAHAAAGFEAEADYVGMYYMARAGYGTDGVEEFWRKMAVEAPDAIFVKSDHPPTPDRFLAIAAAAKEIEAKRLAGAPLVPNQIGGQPAPAAVSRP